MSFDPGSWLADHRGQATMLGVCPMAEEIVEAALREARVADGFVPMFIATPRQVDGDRGYTGWSQAELAAFVDEMADTVGYDGPIVLARDHGGPYQSMRDRGDADVPLSRAMAYAKDLFAEDLAAGFDILHVDATEDARVDGILDLDEVTRRTVELIDHVEAERAAGGHPPVYYEVGTEEITGGMTDPADFERFIRELHAALDDADRSEVLERLLFVVGQIGTTMQIDMENSFDPDKAAALTEIVASEDLHLKVHYTDWLADEDLGRFPDLGIGGANVGPEFAAAMVAGFERLEAIEAEVVSDPTERSDFMDVFADAAVADAPWEKFAPDDLADEEAAAFAEAHREEIAYCVGRYVFNDPAVREARTVLYEHIESQTPDTDPNAVVVRTIQERVHRYVDAFGLA